MNRTTRIGHAMMLASCFVLIVGQSCTSARGEFIVLDHVGETIGDSFSFSTTFSEAPDFFSYDQASRRAHSVAYDLTWNESVSPGPQSARGTDVVLRLRGDTVEDLQMVVLDAQNWGTGIDPVWIEIGSVPVTIIDRTLAFEVSNDMIRDDSGSFFLNVFALEFGGTTNHWYGYVGPVPEPGTSTMFMTALAFIACSKRCRRRASFGFGPD